VAQLESNQIGARMGYRVAAAGDTNGDGYGDVLVSAYFYDDGISDEGAVFVYHGAASGIADGNAAAAATRLESNQTDAQVGYSVAGAGDVNGDGYGDVIVSAPFYDVGRRPRGSRSCSWAAPRESRMEIPPRPRHSSNRTRWERSSAITWRARATSTATAMATSW
jgi:hypothetical protein